mmetsp:Transcript_17138/g.47522  ORF Transcript_17138/g.47522 Transcript_17138/m.47522 type:complete len:275 (-) Transcript_17138:585-1409(-)
MSTLRSLLLATSRERPLTTQDSVPGPSPHNARYISPSSGVHPTCASTTIITISAFAAAARERSTPKRSTLSTLSRMPAVSSSVRGTPPTTKPASTTSRVVPAISVTIARSLELHALSRLDFPTFGRPTMATVMPERSNVPVRAVRKAASMPSCSDSTCPCSLCASMSGKSSSKSRRASSSAIRESTCARSSPTAAPTPPANPANAESAAPVVRACSNSETASAWERSRRPFRNARKVNSPGPALRAPASKQACKTLDAQMPPPCTWNSTTSSRV